MVAFVCGVCWRYGWQLYDVYGKVNYAGIVGVVGLGVLVGVAGFLGEIWAKKPTPPPVRGEGGGGAGFG